MLEIYQEITTAKLGLRYNPGKGEMSIKIYTPMEVQSTLVISNSKGPSETLRDIRTSTYQICRIGLNIFYFEKILCTTYIVIISIH